MRITGRDYANQAAAHKQALVSELSAAQRALGEKGQQRSELNQRLNQAHKQLVDAILPELSHGALDRAVQLTGFVTLRNESPILKMEQERQGLAETISAIEADPKYRDRELLRAPRIGTLTRAIAELEEFRAPLAELVERCQHPRLAHLLSVAYDTPAYGVSRFRLSYYRDWQAGDEILERVSNKGFTKFGQLRQELLQSMEGLRAYDTKLASLRAELSQGEALEQQRTECLNQMESLAVRHLAQSRDSLGIYLRDLDPALVADRLGVDPQVELLFKRYHGLVHQLKYLEEADKWYQGQVIAPIQGDIQKLDRDIDKFTRPKNAFQPVDPEMVRKRLAQRTPRYQKFRQRYEDVNHSVYHFHHYERVNYTNDYLWWDLMTDGRLDGNFIPEVHDYHHHHPHYRYERSWDDDEVEVIDAVSATIDRDDGDVGMTVGGDDSDSADWGDETQRRERRRRQEQLADIS